MVILDPIRACLAGDDARTIDLKVEIWVGHAMVQDMVFHWDRIYDK